MKVKVHKKPKQPEVNPTFLLCFSYYDGSKQPQPDDWFHPRTTWSGPYRIPGNTLQEAKALLQEVFVELKGCKASPFYSMNLCEIEESRHQNGMRHDNIKKAMKAVLWRRRMAIEYPNGIPKYRSIDDS